MEYISKGTKKKELRLESYRAPVCQTCQSHTNKPSFCSKMGTHVSRKHSCMNEYKWNGLFLQRLVEVK